MNAEKLETLKKAVIDYSYRAVDGTRLISAADVKALQYVVRALQDMNYEAAAVESGATDLSLEVWEKALKSIG